MASNYRNAAAGLADRLTTGVPGLKVFQHPPDSANEFPCAIVLPEPVDLEIMLGGNTFTGRFRVVCLVASGDDAEGFASLYDYLDPTETNKSLVAAIRAERTLGGKVDDCNALTIENVGRRELWGGFYFGFDIVVEFIKTVA